ncbi:MAG: ABC-type branched-chain amino acid transport system, ATPase component [Frankiales bacterium]|nr:ABC-type branched-chain amino acid transport system, ATPase component [Frankiales bacterium]
MTTAPPSLASLHAVDFSYGQLQVLFGVDLEIREGEILGLLGTNGAGKSTVLRVLSGLAPAQSGEVLFRGQAVGPAEDVVRRGLAMVPGGKAMFPDLTVAESLEIGGRLLPKNQRRTRIERELTRFPRLAERRTSQSGSLSGGEQQQLAIAKALLLDPALLCIDELSLGLAPLVVESLLQTVRDVRAAGTTVVVVEQSLNIAVSLCDRAVFLEKGTIRFEGRPQELLERGDIARSVFLGAANR